LYIVYIRNQQLGYTLCLMCLNNGPYSMDQWAKLYNIPRDDLCPYCEGMFEEEYLRQLCLMYTHTRLPLI